MKTKTLLMSAAFAAVSAMGVSHAQAEDLTLCWAAWDPANALVELSKDFEAKSGNKMHFEFVPWTNFADRMLNELNSGGKLCDLMIGDSQWIGGSAEAGHYIKLNDFFDANGIKMEDFVPATVVGYSEWPKNTPNYWALPAELGKLLAVRSGGIGKISGLAMAYVGIILKTRPGEGKVHLKGNLARLERIDAFAHVAVGRARRGAAFIELLIILKSCDGAW